ncbi:hypothetical protein ASE16_00345 [Leifsonia sp. Root227]|uniref:sigma-70 family RNA polymerase sigma factor n=1 Tax=Leifsonia sp. Root227 TaxID=1736496 RepID=UPI0006F93721|nr:sigma-70 family RNA polymerase sigma factor [Leifsonia sp. Root227]KRC51588.1 hypothetical protein ASE16_00345 [Leifsonia sp. Root227]
MARALFGARRDVAGRSDGELVELTRTGDRDAYGELWRRHASAGLAVARSHSPSLDADDLVSEAFARIFKAIESGGGPTAAFRPYLFTTIRNTAAGWGRARREIPVDDADLIEDPRFSEDAQLAALDGSLAMTAFRTLSAEWQEVLWYTEVEGLAPRELAPLLGISANSAAALAYRAREGLRQAWIQAHLASVPADSECKWTIDHLGAHLRGKTAKRTSARIERHLDGCADCTMAARDAGEANRQVGLALLPLVAGIGGAVAYTAWLSTSGAGGAASAATLGGVGMLGGGAGAPGGVAGGSVASGSASSGSAASGSAASGGATSGVAGVGAAGSTSGAATGTAVLVGAGLVVGAIVVAGVAVFAAVSHAPAEAPVAANTSAHSSSPVSPPAVKPVASPSAPPTASPTPVPTVPVPEDPAPADQSASDGSQPAPSTSSQKAPTATPKPTTTPKPTATPKPTPTPKPTSTPTPTPTSTPTPTAPAPVVTTVDTAGGRYFPILSGTAAPGATVTITASAGTVAVTADAGGAWTSPPISDLATGTSALSVTQTDAQGRLSPAASVTVALDAPALTLDGRGDGTSLTITGVPRARVEGRLTTSGSWSTLALDGSGRWESSLPWWTGIGTWTVQVRYAGDDREGPIASASLNGH